MALDQGERDTPPGLNYMNLKRYASGGDENDWLPFTKVKYYTNAFIVKDDKVLPLLLCVDNSRYSLMHRFY